MRICITIMAVAIFAGGTSALHGDLVLNINTVNQTFYFTGDDTATGNAGTGLVGWTFFPNVEASSETLSNQNSTILLTGAAFDGVGVMLNFGLGTIWWDLLFDTDANNTQFTMAGTGPGNAVSYARLGDNITTFEASIGLTSSGFAAGTGQSTMTIVASTIPEPSSVLALALLAIGAAAAGRRRAG